MPDPAFLKLYREAMVRDCPAIWLFFEQRESFGCTDWLKMIDYAANTVALGDEFIDNVNRVAIERGLIDEETPARVCPRCKRESCQGATRIQQRTMVSVM